MPFLTEKTFECCRLHTTADPSAAAHGYRDSVKAAVRVEFYFEPSRHPMEREGIHPHCGKEQCDEVDVLRCEIQDDNVGFPTASLSTEVPLSVAGHREGAGLAFPYSACPPFNQVSHGGLKAGRKGVGEKPHFCAVLNIPLMDGAVEPGSHPSALHAVRARATALCAVVQLDYTGRDGVSIDVKRLRAGDAMHSEAMQSRAISENINMKSVATSFEEPFRPKGRHDSHGDECAGCSPSWEEEGVALAPSSEGPAAFGRVFAPFAMATPCAKHAQAGSANTPPTPTLRLHFSRLAVLQHNVFCLSNEMLAPLVAALRTSRSRVCLSGKTNPSGGDASSFIPFWVAAFAHHRGVEFSLARQGLTGVVSSLGRAAGTFSPSSQVSTAGVWPGWVPSGEDAATIIQALHASAISLAEDMLYECRNQPRSERTVSPPHVESSDDASDTVHRFLDATNTIFSKEEEEKLYRLFLHFCGCSSGKYVNSPDTHVAHHGGERFTAAELCSPLRRVRLSNLKRFSTSFSPLMYKMLLFELRQEENRLERMEKGVALQSDGADPACDTEGTQAAAVGRKRARPPPECKESHVGSLRTQKGEDDAMERAMRHVSNLSKSKKHFEDVAASAVYPFEASLCSHGERTSSRPRESNLSMSGCGLSVQGGGAAGKAANEEQQMAEYAAPSLSCHSIDRDYPASSHAGSTHDSPSLLEAVHYFALVWLQELAPQAYVELQERLLSRRTACEGACNDEGDSGTRSSHEGETCGAVSTHRSTAWWRECVLVWTRRVAHWRWWWNHRLPGNSAALLDGSPVRSRHEVSIPLSACVTHTAWHLVCKFIMEGAANGTRHADQRIPCSDSVQEFAFLFEWIPKIGRDVLWKNEMKLLLETCVARLLEASPPQSDMNTPRTFRMDSRAVRLVSVTLLWLSAQHNDTDALLASSQVRGGRAPPRIATSWKEHLWVFFAAHDVEYASAGDEVKGGSEGAASRPSPLDRHTDTGRVAAAYFSVVWHSLQELRKVASSEKAERGRECTAKKCRKDGPSVAGRSEGGSTLGARSGPASSIFSGATAQTDVRSMSVVPSPAAETHGDAAKGAERFSTSGIRTHELHYFRLVVLSLLMDIERTTPLFDGDVALEAEGGEREDAYSLLEKRMHSCAAYHRFFLPFSIRLRTSSCGQRILFGEDFFVREYANLGGEEAPWPHHTEEGGETFSCITLSEEESSPSAPDGDLSVKVGKAEDSKVELLAASSGESASFCSYDSW